ncbi:MAG TPA: UvrD-helicase domain-containing protein [Bacteroidota bacterium]|nr:UvrD-helicase domain-containing protein [Bacteroidota bacterium]
MNNSGIDGKLIEKLLDGLNPEQLVAVKSINGPVQVIAGAGSGKTRVLTTRVAYLIAMGVPPEQILALTFTNKAAREMKSRIANFLSEDIANSVWAGTFHSIFARILRIEADKINYKHNFSIYDQEDQVSLIREIQKEIGISGNEYSPNSVQAFISRLKNNIITPEDFSRSAKTSFEKVVLEIYTLYQERLRENNAMDFDDLLLNTLTLFNEHKDVLEKYQKRFKYICVDEFQDTNRPQYLIVQLLAKAHQNLFVVGDDAQSIYRWRGAEIRNILDFSKDYPYAKMVRLEQNYRSTSNILDAAHSVIINNKNQIEKKLWTNNKKGDLIKVISAEDETQEAQKVRDLIYECTMGEHHKYRDIAILYRTNAQSLMLERALRFSNIPYRIYGGVSFYQRKEVKDAVAYLRLLINSNDSVSLMRIINEPPRGLAKVSLTHLRNYAIEHHISLMEAFLRADDNPNLVKRTRSSAIQFANFIQTYQDLLVNNPLEQVVPLYLNETGLLKMYEEIDTSEARDRLNNILQLINDIIKFSRENPNLSLVDYLQQISLLTDFDTSDLSENYVTLMTLHTAKGLEFPIIIITGLENGLFPLAKAENSPDELEEERRLFYVGLTRAKERVYLFYARHRIRYGEHQSSTPSNFLLEIDKEYLDWNEIYNNIYQRLQSNGNYQPSTTHSGKYFFDDEPKKNYYSQLPEDNSFRVGEKVIHPHFGEGKIIAIFGSGESTKLTVDFKSVGRKQLMAQFARLEKID